jgi:hypothetical protein
VNNPKHAFHDTAALGWFCVIVLALTAWAVVATLSQ